MKHNELKYIQASLVQAATIIDFHSPEEFCSYAEATQAKLIFKLSELDKELEHFAMLQHHALLRLPSAGYHTLQEYIRAQRNAFPSANIFYQAESEGYVKYEEYKMVKEAGIATHSLFEKVKATGFITGFNEFKHMLLNEKALPDLPSFANPYELYLNAMQNGFENFAAFKKAILSGFTNADTLNAAHERGFSLSADYNQALQQGFANYTEYNYAKQKSIKDRADLIKYNDLKTIGEKDLTHDKRLLLVWLSKIEQGKKISINKIIEHFNKAKDEYKYADTGGMPAWFTTSLSNPESFIEFITKSHDIMKYGQYDADGEFFQINRMQDRAVMIDGSNVAHNSNGNVKSKPTVSNMTLLVNYLKQKGFQDISIIADASLYHKLEDKESLTELKAMADYQEAPSETPADLFIIQYVKTKHCLLVSNDTFREWKMQDPWVAGNIDYYRLSFMIKGGEVLMPDLK